MGFHVYGSRLRLGWCDFFFLVLARNVGDRDEGEGRGGCKYHVHDYVADQRLDRLLATTVAVCH